jgi:D-glycero-alpha-D-manno-heptose-7-phosphate kinase
LVIVCARAPIRVCDNGGWTDTWFSGHGRVFNIAVAPYTAVEITALPQGSQPAPVVINAENFGDRYAVDRASPRHPLLEGALEMVPLPPADLVIDVHSEAPAGGATGTSASVAVALIAALDALTPGRLTRHEIAATAHRLETERLGMQSGIQDQFCVAYGGINLIEMPAYPTAVVEQIRIPGPEWWELERRLVLVFLGRSHHSSAVHEEVIASLSPGSSRLDRLRDAAVRSRDAVAAGDLVALGRAMVDNTDAQADLHPSLVGSEAAEVIDVARDHGALGWKVNGAGGDGGSLTLLTDGPSAARRALERAIVATLPAAQIVPTQLDRAGLRVWSVDEVALR